jgi:hypothetical protein
MPQTNKQAPKAPMLVATSEAFSALSYHNENDFNPFEKHRLETGEGGQPIKSLAPTSHLPPQLCCFCCEGFVFIMQRQD